MPMNNREPIFKIQNIKIKCVPSVRILGININRQLNFNSHLKHLKGEISRMACNMDSVAGKRWGIRADLARVWYLTLVYS